VWTEALDGGLKVVVLFIYFMKALYCVHHTNLGEKRKAIGVSGDTWKWLMDYLTLISQLTEIDDSFSESKVVKIRVHNLIIHGGKSNTIIFDTKPFVGVLALSLGR